ncbi:MAG: glycerophosphodiester phosphodiesterase, partial [Myxococcales bacterium]|nr:glycerophosphodiester phosphodiesterase [Myxococcales bacterium]
MRVSRALWVTLVVGAACGEEKASPAGDTFVDAASEIGMGSPPVDGTSGEDMKASADTEQATDLGLPDTNVTDLGPSDRGGRVTNRCFAPGGPTQVVAHRGGARLRPEHTLAAYDHAIAIGADVIELDLRVSADGVVVVIHDDTVDRTTDGEGAVIALSFESLQALDAGYRFDSGAYRGQGLRIPSFEEILVRYPGVCMSLELKTDSLSAAGAVVDLIDASDAGDSVLLVSFAAEPLEFVRARHPEWVTGMNLSESLELGMLDDAGFAKWQTSASVWQPPFAVVDAASMARANARGLIAQPWTVNDSADMTRLLALGVDGIITDDPVKLLLWLEVNGREPNFAHHP